MAIANRKKYFMAKLTVNFNTPPSNAHLLDHWVEKNGDMVFSCKTCEYMRVRKTDGTWARHEGAPVPHQTPGLVATSIPIPTNNSQ